MMLGHKSSFLHHSYDVDGELRSASYSREDILPELWTSQSCSHEKPLGMTFSSCPTAMRGLCTIRHSTLQLVIPVDRNYLIISWFYAKQNMIAKVAIEGNYMWKQPMHRFRRRRFMSRVALGCNIFPIFPVNGHLWTNVTSSPYKLICFIAIARYMFIYENILSAPTTYIKASTFKAFKE